MVNMDLLQCGFRYWSKMISASFGFIAILVVLKYINTAIQFVVFLNQIRCLNCYEKELVILVELHV